MHCWTGHLLCNLAKYTLHTFLLLLPLLVNQSLWYLTQQPHTYFCTKESLLTTVIVPAITRFDHHMSHLLISRIIHDKFYFVVFVHLQEFGKHCQVFENDLVGAKYEICEGLKA